MSIEQDKLKHLKKFVQNPDLAKHEEMQAQTEALEKIAENTTPKETDNKELGAMLLSMLRGPKGEQGDLGADGADGRDGAPGVDGKDGLNGKDGRDGLDGSDGLNGKDGKIGLQGPPGINGRDGQDGKNLTPIHIGDRPPEKPKLNDIWIDTGPSYIIN